MNFQTQDKVNIRKKLGSYSRASDIVIYLIRKKLGNRKTNIETVAGVVMMFTTIFMVIMMNIRKITKPLQEKKTQH